MHCVKHYAMSNIVGNTEKSSRKPSERQIIPFERYVQSISDAYERKAFIDSIMNSCGVLPIMTVWRWRVGNIRPDALKRKEIARVIRRHSGDSSYTADNLFPVEFYKS